jgi:predicted nucleic acid-binding protein
VVLVETSVLIDYLKGQENQATVLFAEVIDLGIPFGISPYTYQEVLQGARNEREYRTLLEYLGTQSLYELPSGIDSFQQAARIYYEVRRQGFTVRSSIDVRIALTAIWYGLSLLHNDSDFDALSNCVEGLRIWSGIG